jgi:hypothetical protein
MTTEEKITYRQMCDKIAEEWNKEGKPEDVITGKAIWDLPAVGQFPAIHIPYMYDAAKRGNLIGLLLCEEQYAKMFYQLLEKK